MLQYYINEPGTEAARSAVVALGLDAGTVVDRATSQADARGKQLFPTVVGFSLAAHTVVIAGLLLGIAAPNAGGGVTELDVVSVSIVSASDLQAAANASAPIEVARVVQPSDQPGSDANPDAAATPLLQPPALALPPQPLNAALLEAPPVTQMKPPEADAAREPDPTPNQTEAASDARQRGGAPSSPVSVGGVTTNEATASRGEMDRYARDVALLVGRNRPKGVGLKGQVTVEFTLSPADGILKSVAVIRSSRQAKLDALAVTAIEKARYPAPPAGMTGTQLTYRVPFLFE
jgi:periplasmic protein TonB